jgi:hypothetical protein
MLYSVDSITTRGASGLMVLPHWQMLGALEAADGILLFGISTAYVFAVIRAYWPMLIRLIEASRLGCPPLWKKGNKEPYWILERPPREAVFLSAPGQSYCSA